MNRIPFTVFKNGKNVTDITVNGLIMSMSSLYTHVGTVGSIMQAAVHIKHVINIQSHGVSRHNRIHIDIERRT